MNFKKRYTKMNVFFAMLHGVLIGVAAVAIMGFFLIGTKDKEPAASKPPAAEIPASGPATEESPPPADGQTMQLFAEQHGAFSTRESAAAFISEQPSLAKAAIIQAGDQYFVWSSVGLTEQDITASESAGTYRKAFTAETTSCGAQGAGDLQKVLKAKELSEIQDLMKPTKAENETDQTKGFKDNLTAITAFSTDLKVIRLHLLSHYSQSSSCAKISF